MNNYIFYFKPDIKVDYGAFKIHGISNEFLEDKPKIEEKFDEIMRYVKDAELLIHNANFDISFLNFELKLCPKLLRAWGKIEDHCRITDTLMIARKKTSKTKKFIRCTLSSLRS